MLQRVMCMQLGGTAADSLLQTKNEWNTALSLWHSQPRGAYMCQPGTTQGDKC